MTLEEMGDSIHQWTALRVLERLQSPECTDRDLAVALRYLNDFSISCGSLAENSPAALLAEELKTKKLPFPRLTEGSLTTGLTGTD